MINPPANLPPSTYKERSEFYFTMRDRAAKLGFKPGWARIRFFERFGRWPTVGLMRDYDAHCLHRLTSGANP